MEHNELNSKYTPGEKCIIFEFSTRANRVEKSYRSLLRLFQKMRHESCKCKAARKSPNRNR